MKTKEMTEMFRWAAKVLDGQRRKNIPGTKEALDREVQAVLLNRALTPAERASDAVGLIRSKIMTAHGIGVKR